MKRFVVAAASVLAVLAAMPPVAGAGAPPAVPVGDSVTANGTSALCGGQLEISVQSGPSGENPTGQVTGCPFVSGPITCLDVRTIAGPGANFSMLALMGATGPVGTPILLTVFTGTFGSGVGVVAGSDCTQPPGSPTDLGFTGSIRIVDAPPLPTSTQNCKNGGWRSFGVFKNQGDCVSFVATGGKNPPDKL